MTVVSGAWEGEEQQQQEQREGAPNEARTLNAMEMVIEEATKHTAKQSKTNQMKTKQKTIGL